MKRAFAIAAVLAVVSSVAASAAVWENFDSYTLPTAVGNVMFRQPSFSGSTGLQIDSTDPALNSTVVVDSASSSAPNSLQVIWKWLPDGTWLRLTTFSAPTRPNPSIDFTKPLEFKVYYPEGDPVGLAIGVRDNGNLVADGDNGGATGGIEWVGATGTATGYTHTISASPNWQVVTIDFATEPVAAFAGAADGVLNNTRGTLECLMLVRTGSIGPYTMYFDDFATVPEPSSLVALAGGLLGLGGLLRRR